MSDLDEDNIDIELEIAKSFSSADHPIWKFLIMMATILGALWATDSM